MGVIIFIAKANSVDIQPELQVNYSALVVSLFVFIISFLPLMYLSWFKDKNPYILLIIKQIFFWALTGALTIAWIFSAQRFIT